VQALNLLRREFLGALAVSTSTKAAGRGEWFPAERRKYTDEVTGREIWQATTVKDNYNLYFSCQSFTKSSRGLVFVSYRTGKSELFMMDMKSGRLRQLTEAQTGVGYATVCQQTNSICYADNNAVWWLNIDTLETRKIYQVPAGYRSDSLSVDDAGRYAVFGITKSLDKPVSPLQTNHSQVIRVRSDGSGSEMLYEENYWISHVLVNPRDADTILFCHEGGWNIVEQRMWTVHAKTGKLTKIRVEETPEISVGHEYWTENGAAVGYHGSYKGRQWVGRVNKDGTNMREWTLTAPTGHSSASEDGRFIAGDGNIDFPYLTLVKPMGNIGVLAPLAFRGKLDRTTPHAHAGFSADNKWIVYCSSRHGAPNVYLIETPVDSGKGCLFPA
jgi:oligogalacturonide lyase